MTAIRIHLENRGQRLHTFTLRDGRICEANQGGWLWNGARVLNDTIASGTMLRIADDRLKGGAVTLPQPVQSIFLASEPPNAACHSRNARIPGAAFSSSRCRAGASAQGDA